MEIQIASFIFGISWGIAIACIVILMAFAPNHRKK